AASSSWQSSASAVHSSGSTCETLKDRTDSAAGRSAGPEGPPAGQDQHPDDADVQHGQDPGELAEEAPEPAGGGQEAVADVEGGDVPEHDERGDPGQAEIGRAHV